MYISPSSGHELLNLYLSLELTSCFYMFEQRIKISIFIYKIYEKKSKVMISSTHSFAYSYQLFKKRFMKNCKTLQFHIFLTFNAIFLKMYRFGRWWKWQMSLMGFVYRVVWVLKALWIYLSETINSLRKLHNTNIFGMPQKIIPLSYVYSSL